MGRSSFEGRLLAALGLAGAAALLAWRWQTAAPMPLSASLVLLWLGGCMLAWRHWRRAPVGELQWRDGGWIWLARLSPADAGLSLKRLRVALDFQTVLLLEVTPAGPGPRWLWLSRRDEPARWNALRRAVHGRVGLAQAGQAAVADGSARS